MRISGWIIASIVGAVGAALIGLGAYYIASQNEPAMKLRV